MIMLSLARQFVFFIPGLYVLSYLLGITGIWISMPISDILGFITAGLWLYREYQLQKRSEVWEKVPAVVKAEA
jgi:Na+-driven multidrug efflux pump